MAKGVSFRSFFVEIRWYQEEKLQDLIKNCLGTGLGGSWRPLGASWGGKVRQESGFEA